MKTVIFDLDGTLLDTRADLKNSTNYALEKFGFSTQNLEKVRKSVGNGIKLLVKRCLPDNTDDATLDDVFEAMKSHYNDHCHDDTVPYKGIIELLKHLKSEGYQIAVVSNKKDPLVQILKKVYFDGLVDIAVGEDENMPRKPAPNMVEYIKASLNVSEAVFVGDSEVDVQTAKNAGLPFLAVGWGFRSEAVLREAGATVICQTPVELEKAILEM